MLNMQRLEIFVAVVEAGSFTGAAHTLGLTKAVVSFNIKQLEEELGISVLSRSTRQVAITDAGERFYLHCLQLLQDMEKILGDVRSDHAGLRGMLRITTTQEYGARVVVPVISAFAALHPQLRIQHVSSSKNDDLISGRFDVAIRLGQLADSTHHAKLIDWFDILPVASKEYLTTHHDNTITDLKQLQSARWIAHSRLATPLSWQVLTPAGDNVLFRADAPPMIMADSATSLRAFARSGAGVALLPAWLVQEDIANGCLTPLLPDHHFPRQGIYALYPNTRHVSENVRTFIDFLQSRIEKPNSKQ
ncbi:LysR family transcriptional regulator [Xenorhabdus hominickii]|uniref:LysR family transcriptional regulator n=1 Tax=Xenorhabdus hominickii TaxID=351679 RepID=A0A2G0Q890_XENHO|nr:LysR family transcriptional regulator [Xenorhabdus hominickii]AOM41313.1 LysR family transcriptional regulator [Xenorhabdus hominickii]PHM55426.1 transcriptional regulator PtxR [Xenorhabdus hominickii]PHM57209.1 transcriptional regulator PtxR [Xenorhabdus hominickii]